MILYEDNDIIVCHKKAGVPVQSARMTQPDMVSMLNNHLAGTGKNRPNGSEKRHDGRRRESAPDHVYVVHRLDQPVEGVIVFARNQKAAAELSGQISCGSMHKVYRAVCCKEAAGAYEKGGSYQLVDYLVKDGRTNTSRVGRESDRNARRAELTFRVLAEQEKYLLAEIDLKTGRHHQIRVQMAHAGLPLYGDQKYNQSWQEYLPEFCQTELSGPGRAAGNAPAVRYRNITPALCAVSLTFCHPATGKKVSFQVTPETEAFGLFS
jgi:23S rRNA pseudouridine1911/1915/1917 synthase